jgi:hypothetical protein
MIVRFPMASSSPVVLPVLSIVVVVAVVLPD